MWIDTVTTTVLASLDDRFGELGWAATVREDDYVAYASDRGDDIWFEAGLDVGARPWGLSLSPGVSVRHARVSRLVARFFGFARGGSQAGAALLDLLGDQPLDDGSRPRWSILEGDDPAAAVDQVFADLQAYGLPFLERFASLPAIARHLAEHPDPPFGLAYLAVAQAEAGDPVQAGRALAEYRLSAESDPPAVGRQTLRFVAAFERHYGVDN